MSVYVHVSETRIKDEGRGVWHVPADSVDAASGRAQARHGGALVHVAEHLQAGAGAQVRQAGAGPGHGQIGGRAQLLPVRRAGRRAQLALGAPRDAQRAAALGPTQQRTFRTYSETTLKPIQETSSSTVQFQEHVTFKLSLLLSDKGK